MDGYKGDLARLGVAVPEVLLPRSGVDLPKWAVVACDQYSSEREYWERARALVGSSPSTLDLIFPEAYLEDSDAESRIASIQSRMRDYLSRGFLKSAGEGMVLVERFTPYEEKPRVGLVLAVDLEAYQYGSGSTSLIRPTEGTIVERLPPRMRIRRGAELELPHIMLLVDDPGRSAIEPIYERRERLPKLYDFDLMLGSGRVRGWRVEDPSLLAALASALSSLADPAAFSSKYGLAAGASPLLFAVGDGNHSLATAKAVWEGIKAERSGEEGIMGHPARYALVELVNVYDEGLPFHPIHRLVSGTDPASILEALKGCLPFEAKRMSSPAEAAAAVDAMDSGVAQRIALISGSGAQLLTFPEPRAKLAAGTVQGFLDPFLKGHPGTSVDYIHGTESLVALASKKGNVGLYLPPIDKSSFFATVVRDGVMPRKTFSMGEAPEKRFYIEARRITR